MNERGWHDRTTPEEAAAYRAAGLWRDRGMAEFLRLRLAETPDGVAVIDDAGRHTYADLDAAARGLAGWLLARGLRPGDVVAFQLPNWHEAAAITLATSMLGLVCLPIVPIYREAEVRFILRASRARLRLRGDGGCPREGSARPGGGLPAARRRRLLGGDRL